MKSDARRALVSGLYPLTNDACAKCEPRPLSCCRPIFCRATEAGLRATGREVPEPGGHPVLKFMGPTGCVVAPELRPLCTRHACEDQPHTNTREYRRAHEREEAKAFADPDVQALAEAGRALLMAEAGPDLERQRCAIERLMGGRPLG